MRHAATSLRADSRAGRDLPAFVLITPAHNEARYIEQTLCSVVRQTVLPLRWVIVDDGSTDETATVVSKYASQYPWIKLIATPKRDERHFAGKADAFRMAYQSVEDLLFEVVANVDADVSFSPDHFEYLLEKFAADPGLGAAGTPFVESGAIAYDYDFVDINHVSGQCQLFRRRCYDDIGGYQPIKGGGVDWTAVTTARMKGWRTQTFKDRSFVHLRVMGTGGGSLLRAKYRFGRQDYYLGSHPLWELARGAYQMTKRPFFVGGLMLMAGYFWAMVSRVEKRVSPELQAFRRKEQMNRLVALFYPPAGRRS